MSVALLNKHIKRMRRIILPSVSCLTIPLFFFTLTHKRQHFGENVLTMKCVLWFILQHLSERFLILRRFQRDIVTNVQTLSRKVPVIHGRFEWNTNFLVRFSKNVRISNFMRIRSVGAEFFDADGRTDMKPIVTICNFTKAPKNGVVLLILQCRSWYTVRSWLCLRFLQIKNHFFHG